MILYLNTIPLELGGFGIGSYTRDIILGFGSSTVASKVVLICPPWLADHPIIIASGLKIEVIHVPEWIPKWIRTFVWSEIAGWSIWKRTEAIFFTPALHASFLVPKNSWVTCHDCLPFHYPVYLGKNPLRKLNYKLKLRFLKRCRGVITDSESSKCDIVNLIGISEERIHVVPCWTSDIFSVANGQALTALVRQKYSLPARYWLYLGGYDIRKNVEFLIFSYAEVISTHKVPPLVLAGKIPSRVHPSLCNIKEALQATDLTTSNVLLPGFIDDSDLPGLYAGAELFIYPSRGEGFGLPPLEAISSGCPAIVADNSSLLEVVQNPNYRFPADNNKTLKKMLVMASQKPFELNINFNEFSIKKSLLLLIEAFEI